MAVASAVIPVRQKNLTCGVCQEIYRSPRLLPCFHSFCLVCIEGLANTNGRVFPCPVCRKPTQVLIGGVRAFQTNFYITEEELQLARNSTEATMCPKHSTELVIFLCKECDEVICIRCKLLRHNQHDCEDLSEAATGCRDSLAAGVARLQGTISRLTKQLHLAEDNTKAAQRKTAVLKEQIGARRDLLMSRVNRWHDETVKNMDSVADTLEAQLKENERQVQHELDSLLPLRERVQHALGSACDADIVACEREVRVGIGSEAALARAEAKAQQHTHRPGLHCNVLAVTDDDLCRFFGTAVILTMPSLPQTETITKIYQFGRPGEFREIHSICPHHDSRTVHLLCGGVPPEYLEEKEISLNLATQKIKSGLKGKRITLKRCRNDPTHCFMSTYNLKGSRIFTLNSKSEAMVQCVNYSTANTWFMNRIAIELSSPFRKSSTMIFVIHASTVLAFDVSQQEENFVVLEEKPLLALTPKELVSQERKAVWTDTLSEPLTHDGDMPGEALDTDHTHAEDSIQVTTRRVRIYRKPHLAPISTYTPPDPTFHPSDVCFWTVHGEEKLLIADWMNDSIHVVKVDEYGNCLFERYLAVGHGDLVKPSALNTDSGGRLWIGCANGWLLRCEEAEESDCQQDMVSDM